MRLIVSALVHLAANAVGLIVADLILGDMSLTLGAFVFATVLFTIVEVVAGPMLTKLALTKAEALQGGVALVTTAVGLVVTELVVDGLDIVGIETWVAAVVVVWLAALLATVLLPIILVKRGVESARKRRR